MLSYKRFISFAVGKIVRSCDGSSFFRIYTGNISANIVCVMRSKSQCKFAPKCDKVAVSDVAIKSSAFQL